MEVIQLYWLKKNNVEAEDIDKSTEQTMNSPTCGGSTIVIEVYEVKI